MILDDFSDFIKKEDLFLKKDKVLVAVSGGLDSVVLCEMMHQAKFKFGIAHCNFGLRGKESDGDEKFVKKLADKYGVPFYSKRFETDKYASDNKISIQMAARELRYDWFEEIRKSEKYEYIATAHHQNDVVETVLMNLIKGTGIAGLHGILPKKNNLIRPLLFANREEIEIFAKEEKLKFREDSSNASDKYLRNKIRHQIIPIMKEINPSLEKTFAENIKRVKYAEELYWKEVERDRKYCMIKQGNEIIFDFRDFNKEKSSLLFLYEFLSPYNFNAAVINEIYNLINNDSNITGKQFYSSTHRIIVNRDELILVDKSNKNEDEKFIIEQSTNQNSYISYLTTETFSLDFPMPKRTVGTALRELNKKNYFYADFKKLKFPLTVRRWKSGDFFYPLGMNKKKKISDFLIDAKVPLNKKENTFVMISGDDIVCVLGHRIDNRYKITDDTKKVFTIHFKEK